MVNVTVALTETEIQSLKLAASHKGIEVTELIKHSALVSVGELPVNNLQSENTTTHQPLSKALTLLMNEYGLV